MFFIQIFNSLLLLQVRWQVDISPSVIVLRLQMVILLLVWNLSDSSVSSGTYTVTIASAVISNSDTFAKILVVFQVVGVVRE